MIILSLEKNMKIYVHNYLEPLSIASDLYEEKHSDQIGNAFGLSAHHYLSDVNLDYWIYKNSQEDIIGKAQYRKWFLNKDKKKYERHELEEIFKNFDIMLYIGKCDVHGRPVKNISCYDANHASFDLRLVIEIIYQITGATEAGEFAMYMYDSDILAYANLYIAKKEIIFEYYNWLFPILKVFVNRSSFRHYPDKYQQRAPGYIAERLFSFWCLYKKDLKLYPTDMNHKEALMDNETKSIRFTYP